MMQQNKTTSLVLLIGGLVLAVLSILADTLGLGFTDTAAHQIGALQLVGLFIGVVVALVGGYLYFK